MSAARRVSIVVLVTFVLLAVAVVGGLRWAGSWLAQVDQPAAADVIVVLAGEPFRALHAAELYARGHAPRVLVSRPARYPRERMLDELGVAFPRAEDVYIQVLIRKGVPLERIAVFGANSISTVDEALALRPHLPPGAARVLVVTSPYHARRARMVFADTLPHARVRVVATPHEPFPERWWQSQDAARQVLLELAKIAFYAGGGRFSADRQTP